MRTEISSKFHAAGIADELVRANFEPMCWWTDSAGDFGLSLSIAG
jgi:L-histidine N-alpha-methyltransferase